MNTNDYRLKEKQANSVSDIASCIDDLRSDLNRNSDSNCKQLVEISASIDAIGSQLSLLNKTMNRIANAMEANND